LYIYFSSLDSYNAFSDEIISFEMIIHRMFLDQNDLPFSQMFFFYH